MAKLLKVLLLLIAFIVSTSAFVASNESSVDDGDVFDEILTTRAGEKTIDECRKKTCTKETADQDCACGVQGAGGLIKYCGPKNTCKYCGKYKNYCSLGESGDGKTGVEYGTVKCCDTIGVDYGATNNPPSSGVDCREPAAGTFNRRWKCLTS